MDTEQAEIETIVADEDGDICWPTIREITDAEMSALGNARHLTINGRGIVGRLVDKHREERSYQ